MRGLGLRNGCDSDGAEQSKLILIMNPILTLPMNITALAEKNGKIRKDFFRLFSILSASMLLLSPLALQAATYTVAPNGADSNPGTEAQPFRTIQKAADVAAAGDTVHVRAGVYAENVIIKNSGTEGRPIVFEGERGNDGKWLTIVDRSKPVRSWAAAPEIGAGVFKTTLDFEPYCMTLDGKQLARINDRWMKEEKGIGYFKMAADAMIKEDYVKELMPFWDAVEAIYGVRDGVTYIRFRNGDDPSKLVLNAAAAGGGFAIKDKSHIVIRRFLVRGAQDSIVIEGEKASRNVIEENSLMNGHNRVVLQQGASHNLVRGNEMTLNYYGYDNPGAWDMETETQHTAKRTRVYRFFKYKVGTGSSDDRGVMVTGAGEGNEIADNHIYAGVIGILCSRVRNLDVHHNTIRNMSSIGLLTIEGVVDGHFHDNLIYDCNINLRIHHYNTPGDNERREFHYRNRFYNPAETGNHIYVHWLDELWPPNTEHAQIWIYQNSFAGGKRAMAVSGWSVKGGGLQRTRLLNNVFSSASAFSAASAFRQTRTMLDQCDYNWLGGALPTGEIPWLGQHNILAKGKAMWPADKLPDFALTADSDARGKGLDLSKPFTLDGKTHDPLPGMKPGYFQGASPDLGAVQFGER